MTRNEQGNGKKESHPAMNEETNHPLNIVIVGTAGQGVITLKRFIEHVAMEEGYECIYGSEMHGLAQREGAISSHCRLQREASPNTRENLHSPTICHGDADIVIGLEPVEVLRNAGLLCSEKTVFAINSRDIPPIMVTAGKQSYPSLDEIQEILERYSGGKDDRIHFLNATNIALEQLGDARKMNMIMLGFTMAVTKLSFSMDACNKVATRELKDSKMNEKAIELGLNSGKNLKHA